MNLVESKARDVFADTGYQLIAFDGTPYARPATVDGWPVVGQVDTVNDWAESPGSYGPHYAVGSIVNRYGETFTAGGSIVFIRVWCNENDASFHFAQIVSDRNEARRRAEQRGGVAW